MYEYDLVFFRSFLGFIFIMSIFFFVFFVVPIHGTFGCFCRLYHKFSLICVFQLFRSSKWSFIFYCELHIVQCDWFPKTGVWTLFLFFFFVQFYKYICIVAGLLVREFFMENWKKNGFFRNFYEKNMKLNVINPKKRFWFIIKYLTSWKQESTHIYKHIKSN